MYMAGTPEFALLTRTPRQLRLVCQGRRVSYTAGSLMDENVAQDRTCMLRG